MDGNGASQIYIVRCPDCGHEREVGRGFYERMREIPCDRCGADVVQADAVDDGDVWRQLDVVVCVWMGITFAVGFVAGLIVGRL